MHHRTAALSSLFLFVAFTAFALTRGQLAARFGRSAWRQTMAGSDIVTTEQFVPDSGIALTARYDEHGNVREIRIAPQGPESDEHGTTRSVKMDTAEKILNQLIPKKQQPAEGSSASTGTCAHTTTSSNDELTITREFYDCAPKGLNVTISWK